MSPEVLDEQGYNFKADIWSLGTVPLFKKAFKLNLNLSFLCRNYCTTNSWRQASIFWVQCRQGKWLI